MERFAKLTAAATGILVGYLFGGWTIMLEVVMVLAVADYLTGLIAASFEGKLNSKVGFKGVFKKILMFVIISVAHFADKMIGQGSMIMNAACFFYAGNELLSIIENAGRVGLPVPDILKKAVEVLRSKEGDSSGPKP